VTDDMLDKENDTLDAIAGLAALHGGG